MKKLAVLVMALVLLVSSFGVIAQEGTIVDVAAGNEDFSTLVSLVEAAGLAETLSGEGPFTVFAPTNDVFAALPEFVVEFLGNNPDVLASILTYHVVPGQVMAADVTTGEVGTVNGDAVNLVVGDTGVLINGQNVTATDIEASNGVIHVIDGLLVPTIELPEVFPDEVTGDIITAGSSTVGPLTERMASLFEEEGYIDNLTIDIIGSGAGFERFCVAGETDISNASRPIRDSEVESCNEIGRSPIEFRVGTDALSVTVSTENDFVEDVTAEELAAIFSTAETWADVRPEWPAEPIQRFIPGTDSGTFDFFVEEVFDENEEPILNAANLQLSEDDNVLVTGVTGSPFAIGFFGFAYFQENSDVLRPLAIDGVSPTAESAESGEYPLARPLFIYSDPDIIAEKPQVAAFINYYLTTVNDEVVDVGYFPASDNALNTARLKILAAMGGGM